MVEAAGMYVSTLAAYEEGLTVVTGKVRGEGGREEGEEEGWKSGNIRWRDKDQGCRVPLRVVALGNYALLLPTRNTDPSLPPSLPSSLPPSLGGSCPGVSQRH